MRTSMTIAALGALLVAMAGCKRIDPLFCSEEKPCTDPERPFCDLLGEWEASEGVGRTCIPCPLPEGCETGVDAGGGDAGWDAGGDGGEAPAATALVRPVNGYYTGSLHASNPGLAEHPLRPRFVWQEVEAATSYQLQIEDSCDVGSFMTCGFDSPEIDISVTATSFVPEVDLPVSSSPPVGRRYYWRVRACTGTACSAWSRVYYLNVGRVWSDFDGDGYADIVVGAPRKTGNDAGAAYVYYGGPDGPPTSASLTLNHPEAQANAGFGSVVVAIGDVNGDGFGDALVTAPSQDVSGVTDRGKAYVYLGSAAGLSATPARSLDSPLAFTGNYGASGAAGDINGNGFTDVAIGAPAIGRVSVYYGSVSGVPAQPAQVLGDTLVGFGSSVAIGDFDGDGYSDLAVGAPSLQDGLAAPGEVFVYSGSATVVESDPVVMEVPAGETARGGFGVHIAATSDRGNDGFEGLAVADVLEIMGVVYLFRGQTGGLASEPVAELSALVTGLAAGGDVNADGHADVIVGHWNYSMITPLNSGFVFWRGESGSAPTPIVRHVLARGYVATSVGDVNGDGVDDVIVGLASKTDSDIAVGEVGVYFGSLTGVAELPSLDISSPDGEADSGFGASVAAGR
jgi:hypothetical protein